MKTEYRKNLNKSLMITTLERADLNYEVPVLKNNRVEGLLPFEVIAENGRWKVLHDITGQQSLDAWLETETMDSAFFRGMIHSLDRICKAFEPLLLDEDKLCLCPDHIFVKNGSHDLSFSYLPETEQAVTDSFRELLEYLIARLDHHDEELVRLAYSAYEKTADTFRIGELLEQEEPEESREAVPEKAEILYEAPEEEEEESWEAPPVPMMPEKKPLLSGLFDFGKKKESAKPILQSCPEEVEEPFEEATTYLNPDEDYCKGILRYVGSGEETDIKIGEVPFFIGTRVGVGGKLKSQAVSRLHAKITQAGEVYLLEDLNSTNGTFVNEKPLNYKSPVTLHPKDQVRFADEEFLFL